MARIAVLGAGGWGITLAIVLHENGHSVALWEFDKKSYETLLQHREEKDKLPGVKIPSEIAILNNFEQATKDCEWLLCAIPTQFIRKALADKKAWLAGKKIINVSKGIETGTGSRISEIMVSELGFSLHHYAMLSGPSHAEEVSRKIPTAIVAASSSEVLSKEVQQLFFRPYLRVYTNTDLIGVELGGALKNVIAITAGVIDGLGFGDNTKGALLTRGMVEMTRLGLALGASRETFFGLAGMGDLITTCMSQHSRNRFVGEALGKGKPIAEILSGMKMVAEGVETCRSAYHLAKGLGVEMPITERMYAVLFEGEDPRLSVRALMERESKAEDL